MFVAVVMCWRVCVEVHMSLEAFRFFDMRFMLKSPIIIFDSFVVTASNCFRSSWNCPPQWESLAPHHHVDLTPPQTPTSSQTTPVLLHGDVSSHVPHA